MKKTLMVALMLLIAGSAFAVTPKHVLCDVKGTKKMVKTADACKALGGVVVETPKVAKKV
jgi:hypothetical protein